MKIKLYIVTYNNAADLNNNLESLFKSDISNYGVEVYIINNYSKLDLKSEYKKEVTVYENSLRPDFSRGHLARNWNQALINGFQDVNSPDADIVIHAQDDTIWMPEAFELLIKSHETYSFVTAGHGDNICSYTIDGVKSIGLWDERYCTVCYQDADYFLRALIYNREKSTLNDYYHPRKLNLLDYDIIKRPETNEVRQEIRRESNKLNEVCRLLFMQKWGDEELRRWEDPDQVKIPKAPYIPNFITYPYFEKDIPNLDEKYYFNGENSFYHLIDRAKEVPKELTL